MSNFCSPFPEVHRACPTPIDRSPKNIEGFENILAEQKKARILKKMLPLKLKSWKRHITKTGLETENDEQLQKRESEIEPLQSAQTIIHQKVLTAVSSLTILVALLSFCFIVCRASFCCAWSSLIRSNASCSYFVQRNGKGSGINFYDKVSRKFLAIKGILALRTRDEITGGFPIKLTELQCERQTFFFFFERQTLPQISFTFLLIPHGNRQRGEGDLLFTTYGSIFIFLGKVQNANSKSSILATETWFF